MDSCWRRARDGRPARIALRIGSPENRTGTFLALNDEVGGFPEEIGFVCGQQIHQGLHFIRIGCTGNEAKIVAEPAQAVMCQSPLQATGYHHLFCRAHGDACYVEDQTLKASELVIGYWLNGRKAVGKG